MSKPTKENAPIDQLAADVKRYIELKLKYYQLGASQKLGTLIAWAVAFSLVMVMVFTTFLVSLIATGAILAYFLDSIAAGFGILFVLCLIILLLLLMMQKSIVRSIQGIIYHQAIHSIIDTDDED